VTKLNDCGCCGHGDDGVREGIWNDPGLGEIRYRIDRFGGFKRAMREAMNRETALGRLTTRDDSDAALSIIDAWSTTLDVLTFYQERIANENYLRTATEFRSLQEFGREVGYRLAPGTAATTHLAFRVDDTGYGPESVRIDAGTKVQSQPGQDELPQVYETLGTVVARPEYNALPVKEYAKDELGSSRTNAYFAGTAFDVKVGDTMLFVAHASKATPSSDKKALARVTRVVRNDVRQTTYLEWSPALNSDIVGVGSAPGPDVFLMRQRLALFGYNAMDYTALPLTLRIGDKSPQDGTFVAGPYAGQGPSWANAKLTGEDIDLDSLYPSIGVGSWVVLQSGSVVRLFRVDSASEVLANRFMLSGKVTRLNLDRSALTDFSPKDTTVLAQSEPLVLADYPVSGPLFGDTLELAGALDRPEAGRKLLVVGKRPRAKFLHGGELTDRDGTVIGSVPNTEVVRLEEAPTQGDGLYKFLLRRDDGTTGYLATYYGMITFLPPDDSDEPVGELVTVAKEQTGVEDSPLEIKLTGELKHAYDRASTRAYGNVAFASHGETKRDVLGSGDASRPFQRFELSHRPLTYLASASETGYESTLEVRVNDVRWHEAPTLYRRGPKERIFTARENERLKAEVGFGNGITGERPDTGVENVTAKYRVGAGVVGRVRRGQLNMLLTRPLGVTEVTNPLPASGGSDPENVADARANIPRSALTLGRIVSLQDFADHASRYPGVAKAQSTLLWHGDHQVVFLTVSGPEGETIDTTNLEGSVDSVRDTHFPVIIGNTERLRFQTTIEVLVRADYLPDVVLAAAKAAVVETFAFARREFAEAVTVSEIVTAVQRAEGVEAANVTVLDLAAATTPIYQDVLRIKPARRQGGALLPAQILVVDPERIEVKEMKRDL